MHDQSESGTLRILAPLDTTLGHHSKLKYGAPLNHRYFVYDLNIPFTSHDIWVGDRMCDSNVSVHRDDHQVED